MEINIGGTTFILEADQVNAQKLEKKKEEAEGFRLFLNLKLYFSFLFSKTVSCIYYSLSKSYCFIPNWRMSMKSKLLRTSSRTTFIFGVFEFLLGIKRKWEENGVVSGCYSARRMSSPGVCFTGDPPPSNTAFSRAATQPMPWRPQAGAVQTGEAASTF
jgi:hypothetical protein